MSAPLHRLTWATLLAASVSGARATHVDVVHVAASEGRSLGGHVAIRVDDLAYHFQHDAGLLVLAREPLDAFRWRYGVLQNRDMRELRLRLDTQATEALRARLNRRFLEQQQTLAALALRRDDHALLAAWSRADGPTETADVRGAAAFFADGEVADLPIRGLRPDLAAAAAAVRAEIGALVPDAASSIAARYGELVERFVALAVLAGDRPVRADRLRVVPTPPLSRAERARVAAWRRHLARRVRALPRSSRPDWGEALLVTMARLRAAQATLAAGRLVIVAAPAADGTPIDTRRPGALAFAREAAAHARTTLAALRRTTLAGAAPLDEPGWARLETAASWALAVQGWDRPGTRVALGPEDATPRAAARLEGLPRPRLGRAEVAAAARAAERAARAAAHAFATEHGYDLVERNCATELVRVLAPSLPPDAAWRRFDFIPAAAFDALTASRVAGDTTRRSSFRRRRLAAMRETEPAWRVRLREDNVLTSSLYRGGENDPPFAFFTDDTVLARPLYGIANLTVGALATGVGVVTAPHDRARRFRRGLTGMLASLPELVFRSVRTGTMLHAGDDAGDGA